MSKYQCEKCSASVEMTEEDLKVRGLDECLRCQSCQHTPLRLLHGRELFPKKHRSVCMEDHE